MKKIFLIIILYNYSFSSYDVSKKIISQYRADQLTPSEKIKKNYLTKHAFNYEYQLAAFQELTEYLKMFIWKLIPYGSLNIIAKPVIKNISLLEDTRIHENYNLPIISEDALLNSKKIQLIIEKKPLLPLFILSQAIIKSWDKKGKVSDNFYIGINPKYFVQGLIKKLSIMEKNYKYYRDIINKKINYQQYLLCDTVIKQWGKEVVNLKKNKEKLLKNEVSNVIKKNLDLYNKYFSKEFTPFDYFFHKAILAYYGERNNNDYNNNFLKNNDKKRFLHILINNIDYSDKKTQKKIAYSLITSFSLIIGLYLSARLGISSLKFIGRQSLRFNGVRQVKSFLENKLYNIDTGKNKLGLYFMLTGLFNFKNENNQFLSVLERSYFNEKYVESHGEEYTLNETMQDVSKKLSLDMVKVEDTFKKVFFIQDLLINPAKINDFELVKLIKFVYNTQDQEKLPEEKNEELELLIEKRRDRIFNNKRIEDIDFSVFDFNNEEIKIFNSIHHVLWEFIHDPKNIGDWITHTVFEDEESFFKKQQVFNE